MTFEHNCISRYNMKVHVCGDPPTVNQSEKNPSFCSSQQWLPCNNTSLFLAVISYCLRKLIFCLFDLSNRREGKNTTKGTNF